MAEKPSGCVASCMALFLERNAAITARGSRQRLVSAFPERLSETLNESKAAKVMLR